MSDQDAALPALHRLQDLMDVDPDDTNIVLDYLVNLERQRDELKLEVERLHTDGKKWHAAVYRNGVANGRAAREETSDEPDQTVEWIADDSQNDLK